MFSHYIGIIIVVVYLCLMLGIAWWYRRFANRSTENFFLGGRKIPGWLNGISYTAALVSPDAATAYGGLAVVTGSFISWWYLSRFGLALFLGGVLFAIFWRRLNLFTSLEFYDLRFPKRTANAMRLWIAIRTALIAMPAWTGITLLAAYKIMGPAFGWSAVQTLLLIVPISVIYVFFSGYKGVVVSNFIQMALFFFGALILAYLTMSYLGGPQAMAMAIQESFGNQSEEILGLLPPAKHEVFPMVGALAWLFGQSIGYGGDAAPMGGAMEGQRILSSKNPTEALKMYIVTAISMFIILLLVTLPSISAAVIWPEFREGSLDRELVYGKLMEMVLPPWALGLMIAAMLAAAMSTISDNLNFGSQILVNDIYKPWFASNRNDKHYLIAGKLGLILIMMIAIIVVFKVRLVIDVAIFMLQLSAAELPANWAQWWWWRFNGAARIAASFGGAAIFCVVVLIPKLMIWMGVEQAQQFDLPWWWQTLIVMLLTTLLWIVVALMTKPDPESKLKSFYKEAKPLGWWTPFKENKEASKSDIKPILRGIFISLIGFVATSLFILGLTGLWFGDYVKSMIQLGLSIILFYVFKLMIKQYLTFLTNHVKSDDF